MEGYQVPRLEHESEPALSDLLLNLQHRPLSQGGAAQARLALPLVPFAQGSSRNGTSRLGLSGVHQPQGTLDQDPDHDWPETPPSHD